MIFIIVGFKEKGEHCYMKGQTVTYTCVYDKAFSNMTRATITVKDGYNSNDETIMKSVVLGTNTIQTRIGSFDEKFTGEVGCRYDGEICERPGQGEFDSSTTTVYCESKIL